MDTTTPLLTTADLPASFRLEPVAHAAREAIRSSGLQIEGCIHGTACAACVVAAARKVAAATG